MSTDDEDYSDYRAHNASIISALSLFCGFQFTAITLLINALPNREQPLAQVTLFFLTVLFNLSISTLVDTLVTGIYYVRNVPPFTRRIRFYNMRLMLIFYLFGIAIVLMFLLWSLFVLALASAITWALVVILNYIYTVKPFNEYRRKQTIQA